MTNEQAIQQARDAIPDRIAHQLVGYDLDLLTAQIAAAIQQADGTPSATPAAPTVPGVHLMTPDLLHLDPAELHKRLVELRDQHRAHAAYYGRWIGLVRRRAAQAGEVQAAKALGVSRATVRKATGTKAAS